MVGRTGRFVRVQQPRLQAEADAEQGSEGAQAIRLATVERAEGAVQCIRRLVMPCNARWREVGSDQAEVASVDSQGLDVFSCCSFR